MYIAKQVEYNDLMKEKGKKRLCLRLNRKRRVAIDDDDNYDSEINNPSVQIETNIQTVWCLPVISLTKRLHLSNLYT